MAMQGIMQGAQGLLQTGVLPPPMVMQFTLELIKMMLQPIRNSRGVVEMMNDFQEQLQAQMMNPAADACRLRAGRAAARCWCVIIPAGRQRGHAARDADAMTDRLARLRVISPQRRDFPGVQPERK